LSKRFTWVNEKGNEKSNDKISKNKNKFKNIDSQNDNKKIDSFKKPYLNKNKDFINKKRMRSLNKNRKFYKNRKYTEYHGILNKIENNSDLSKKNKRSHLLDRFKDSFIIDLTEFD